jgi:hypothetical protein
MRNLRLLLLGILCCLLFAPGQSASAQGQANDIIYSRFAAFKIPYQTDGRESRLAELQLFVSTDLGKQWQKSFVTSPSQRFFRFEAPADGLYWFTVQTKDRDGRLFPTTLEGVRPSLKVFVDTHPPEITLTSLPSRNGEVGVAWKIRDETLDLTIPGALLLDYRLANDAAWQPVRVDPNASQAYWNPGREGVVEARLRVRDRAENWGEKKIVLDGSGQSTTREGDVPERKTVNSGLPADARVRMVNAKQFTLNYDVKEVGPSGVSEVDIWYTQDGNNWQKYRTKTCTKNPEGKAPYALEISVTDEGLYGFTLVVRSGVGLSDRAPQVGDKPQVWVEVDTTKPEVQLTNIVVGQGVDKGKATFSWRASDKNLSARPITLSYGTAVEGPWTAIAEKLENSGRYVWKIPADVPYEFFVRAEAVDKAGNIGLAVTQKKIAVDLAQPKARILGVEPVGH